jgi:hypothetical protein
MDLSKHRAASWQHYLAWLCLGIAEAVYMPDWLERVVTTVEATVHPDQATRCAFGTAGATIGRIGRRCC